MIRGFDIVYQLYEKGLVCESINWIINLLSSYNELVHSCFLVLFLPPPDLGSKIPDLVYQQKLCFHRLSLFIEKLYLNSTLIVRFTYN